MFVSPRPNSYVEILMSSVRVLGPLEGGAFGRCVCHEDGAFMNGISAFIKEMPQSSLAPSPMWRHSENMTTYELGSRPSPDIDLTTQAPSLQTSSLQNSEI